MGKKAKEHRKKVAARNQRIKAAEKKNAKRVYENVRTTNGTIKEQILW